MFIPNLYKIVSRTNKNLNLNQNKPKFLWKV